MFDYLKILFMTGLIFIPVNWVFAKLIKILFIKKTEPRFIGNAVGVTFIVQYIYIIAHDELVPVTGGWYGGAIQGAAVIVICLISSPIIISSIALLFYSNFNKLILSLYAILLITLSAQFLFYTLIKPRGHPSIEMYGKIVDQNGLPVSNAILYFSGIRDGKYFGKPVKIIKSGPAPKEIYSTHSNVVTDNKGIFYIKGFGKKIYINISMIYAKGYQIKVPTDYKRSSELYRYYLRFSDNRYNYPVENIRLYSDKSSPFLIKAWEIDKPDGKVVIGSHKNKRIKADGTIYTLGIKDDGRFRISESVKNGILQMSCKRGQVKHHLDKVDWELTIIPVKGGIQKTEDYYLNRAPEKDYNENIKYKMDKDSVQYMHHLINEMVYFYSNDHEEYGGLLFDFDSISGFSSQNNEYESCRFSVELIKLNVNGGRNLYLKKDADLYD